MKFNIWRQAVLPLVEQAIEITTPYAMEYGVQLLSNESIDAEALIGSLSCSRYWLTYYPMLLSSH